MAGGRLWFPVTGVSGEPDPLAEVITVEIDGAALAVDVDAVEPGAGVEIDLGGARVRIEQGPAGPAVYRLSAAGAAPEELPAGREAWFSWRARHPDTQRWPER